jgi:hypothetical protein
MAAGAEVNKSRLKAGFYFLNVYHRDNIPIYSLTIPLYSGYYYKAELPVFK